MSSSIPPKGSLEDLFRHHLLESEAAAVPPRPQVWEQVDNHLLLAQNEKYRRRLVAYRWAMAASLLLASLAGGGWWRSQQGSAPAGTLAQATKQPAGQPGLAGPHPGQPVAQPGPLVTATHFSSTLNSSAIDQTATLSASATFSGIRSRALAARHGATARGRGHLASLASSGASRLGSTRLGTATREAGGQNSLLERSATFAPQVFGGMVAGTTALSEVESQAQTLSATASSTAPAMAAASTRNPSAEATLAPRQASLAVLAGSLPPSLAEVAVAPGPALELTRPWQYGLAYAASAYQPNIDWTKPVAAYNPALGPNSASITRSAAAEYRENLRPGLGQRLSLWATRRLGNGRWSLRTGLEVAQNTATSASSAAFVGEQVADLSYTQAGLAYAPISVGNAHRLQRTSYRYRSLSVPAELRYANPAKTGFSIYGRVGAFVSALLNVRSEVEGSPEASRTYTLQSGNSPYRPYSGGLRGGAGVQYRPAGHQWSLNFGPVAELGILSLNADPSQDFWTQQRPYSFGLEAGVELGRGFKIQ